ncbi:hypothetical protein [Ornithinimicrobium sp. W1665]|uniref:hypothetical protein n=1 Tax=Ornithinimicrobium sp. W1665 TaxID=3416666 RepID=UPI003CE6F836
MRMRQRAVRALAAGAALSLLGAGAASAHECYKHDWQQQAYDNLAANGSAWMPVSGMVRMFLVAPDEQETCGPLADAAVAEWVQTWDFPREPLIHSRATIGGGAKAKGKNPPPIGYLTDDQFGSLIGGVVGALGPAGCTLPPMD